MPAQEHSPKCQKPLPLRPAVRRKERLLALVLTPKIVARLQSTVLFLRFVDPCQAFDCFDGPAVFPGIFPRSRSPLLLFRGSLREKSGARTDGELLAVIRVFIPLSSAPSFFGGTLACPSSASLHFTSQQQTAHYRGER